MFFYAKHLFLYRQIESKEINKQTTHGSILLLRKSHYTTVIFLLFALFIVGHQSLNGNKAVANVCVSFFSKTNIRILKKHLKCKHLMYFY